MQRKNHILNHRRGQNRNGFAMIMAIFFMVLMATMMAYMLESTADTTKRTINEYLLEQAQLIAKSSVEYAILQVSDYNRSAPAGGGCRNQVVVTYPSSGLIATVDIQYFGFGSLDSCNNIVDDIQTAESNGTMLMDVYVTHDPDILDLTEPIRYHRRTLQKL